MGMKWHGVLFFGSKSKCTTPRNPLTGATCPQAGITSGRKSPLRGKAPPTGVSLGGYSMAMHALTRQSNISQSASGGKCLPRRADFSIKCRMSPSLENSMNSSPCAMRRLFAIACCATDFAFVVRGGNLSGNWKGCTMCGARQKFCSRKISAQSVTLFGKERGAGKQNSHPSLFSHH